MARRFVRVDVTDAIRDLQNTALAVRQANEDLQIELAETGAEIMKDLIENRGTGRRAWGYRDPKTAMFVPTPMRAKESPRRGSLREGSYPGRVNTGKMRDAVRVKFERGPKKVFADFGWIDSLGKDEQYFEAQEYGFTAGGFRKPQEVKGMFALRDARYEVVRKVLPALIRKYENRIARGRY